MEDLKKAITTTDPEIDQPELEKYLCWAFRTNKDELDDSAPQEKTGLMARLQNGNVRRIGQKLN